MGSYAVVHRVSLLLRLRNVGQVDQRVGVVRSFVDVGFLTEIDDRQLNQQKVRSAGWEKIENEEGRDGTHSVHDLLAHRPAKAVLRRGIGVLFPDVVREGGERVGEPEELLSKSREDSR